MDVTKNAKALASSIKMSREFIELNSSKAIVEKNRNLKKQLDSYLYKQNTIYSRYQPGQQMEEKLAQLNKEYENFFRSSEVNNYLLAAQKFNEMMEKIYKYIESELTK
jgi:cell fate (sporulation/competence/biofilm development) regulator YlbF (YheA/YmcA/DUF963 family)